MTRRYASADALLAAAQSPCPSSTACRSTWTKACLPQHAPYGGRTHRHDVCVEHHERQPAVALQRVLEMKADDGLLLPILQPEVAGNPAVVLVHLPVGFPPVLELAGGDAEPPNEPPGADLGL